MPPARKAAKAKTKDDKQDDEKQERDGRQFLRAFRRSDIRAWGAAFPAKRFQNRRSSVEDALLVIAAPEGR